MNVSDTCLQAIQREWNYYDAYSTLVYPFNSNFFHAIAVGLIPQIFAHLYDVRVGVAVNVLRHPRSCLLPHIPLNVFTHISSIVNGVIYLFPPYSDKNFDARSLAVIGGDIEAHASRPLLAGAVTLILTGIFFATAVLQHPLREVRRIRPMMPYLLGCLFLVVAGTYVFYSTCQLRIKEGVMERLALKCAQGR